MPTFPLWANELEEYQAWCKANGAEPSEHPTDMMIETFRRAKLAKGRPIKKETKDERS